jgi:hypothetical protein
MDMSIARIRTPDEPRTAAWDHTGCNYVGFLTFSGYRIDSWGDDNDCPECTTLDRAAAVLQYGNGQGKLGDVKESEGEEDAEWLPDDGSCADSEPLEYDTDAGTDGEDSSENNHCDAADEDSAKQRNEMCCAPSRKHTPHNTWDQGIRSIGDRSWQSLTVYKQDEHIASPSCQSIRGINGHRLSVAEMKNCRNHRFLLAKPTHYTPPDWNPETVDEIFEENSSFVLSGESNGSCGESRDHFACPPRYGVDDISVWRPNKRCNVSTP